MSSQALPWGGTFQPSDPERPRNSILKGGSSAAQPFATSLSEVSSPEARPRRKSANDAAHARQRMLEEAHAEGFSAGHAEGFPVGQAAGYQAGFDQAYSEASNQHAEVLRAFMADLQHVRDQVDHAIEAWFAASELELESLAVEIAEQLVGTQLTLDRSFIVQTTQTALRQLSEVSNARIRVNPFDSVILSNAREELLAATASLHGVEIVDDADISGGCVIETDRGAVDATIDKRLEMLHGGLEEAA